MFFALTYTVEIWRLGRARTKDCSYMANRVATGARHDLLGISGNSCSRLREERIFQLGIDRNLIDSDFLRWNWSIPETQSGLGDR